MAVSTETALLLDIALIIMGAAIVAVLFTKLRMPLVIGYLLVGMLLGPYVLGIDTISDYIEEVNFLANLGIILLMFSIGLEFNLKRLRRIGSFAILAGTIEVLVMLVIGFEVGQLMGWSYIQSIYLGGVVAISSTAVIVRVLVETGKLDSQVGESVVGLLIVEDVAAVVILTVLGSMSTGDSIVSTDLFAQMSSIAIFLVVTLLLGLAVVPRCLNCIGRTCNDEVLLHSCAGVHLRHMPYSPSRSASPSPSGPSSWASSSRSTVTASASPSGWSRSRTSSWPSSSCPLDCSSTPPCWPTRGWWW